MSSSVDATDREIWLRGRLDDDGAKAQHDATTRDTAVQRRRAREGVMIRGQI